MSYIIHLSDFKDFPFCPALRPLEMPAKASEHVEPMLGWCCFQAAVHDEIQTTNSRWFWWNLMNIVADGWLRYTNMFLNCVDFASTLHPVGWLTMIAEDVSCADTQGPFFAKKAVAGHSWTAGLSRNVTKVFCWRVEGNSQGIPWWSWWFHILIQSNQSSRRLQVLFLSLLTSPEPSPPWCSFF